MTASTEIGRLTIGMMIPKKTWRSLAPSTRAASRISLGMLFKAADRMTVANPTDPHMPAAISAAFTRDGLPSQEIPCSVSGSRMAFSRPMLASGAYTKFQMIASAVAAIAIGRKTTALTADS